jgi:hypothetical protein
MKIKIGNLKFKIEVVFLILLIFGLGIYLLLGSIGNKVVWKAETLQTPVVYTSILDGQMVSSSEQVNPKIAAVMIDNHPDAWPQSGLSAAKIVYEAPAEGGLTRYLAIFDASQKVDKIGPVRSARPYFVDWLQEYNGLYMHCGGSPDALDKIKMEKVFDLNEMYNGAYFWRDNSRFAPHNLFTSSELWSKFLLSVKATNQFLDGWKFADLPAVNVESVKNVSIEYSANYFVDWQYLVDSKKYQRLINEKKQQEEGLDLLGDDIIIQYVKTQVLDDYGRLGITTIGQGDMRLLRDGLMWRGVWKKANGRTRFYDLSGQELILKPGKIWIQIVPKDINIKIST